MYKKNSTMNYIIYYFYSVYNNILKLDFIYSINLTTNI